MEVLEVLHVVLEVSMVVLGVPLVVEVVMEGDKVVLQPFWFT